MIGLTRSMVIGMAAWATVDEEAPESDWVSLFDGETLSGWVTKGGRYDGNADWKVADGAIVGKEGPEGAGGLIYTDQTYRNLEIELETFITYPFDSGVFVRMRPEAKGAQVTLDYRPGGEVGGIYSEGWYFHNPQGSDRYRKDQWNHFRVRCVGDPMHLTVWMNGELLTDYWMPPGGGEFAEDGLVGLQVHGSMDDPPGSHVRFRNLRMRRLPDEAGEYFDEAATGSISLTAQGEALGWRELWHPNLSADEGKSSSGIEWKEGTLALTNLPMARWLDSESVRDFQLRLDFRRTAATSDALPVRLALCSDRQVTDLAPRSELVWLHGRPDNHSEESSEGPVAVEAASSLRSDSEWNTLVVTCHGSRQVIVLNGQVLRDAEWSGAPSQGAERWLGLFTSGVADREPRAVLELRHGFLRKL